jgi:hypothetical protein
MQAVDILDEVVADLENDDNLLRIKRLLLYASRNIWAKTVDEVARYGLRQLIEELLSSVQEIDTLKKILGEQVKRLNNRPEYVQSADTIIGTIGFLYPMRSQLVKTTVSQEPAPPQAKPESIPHPFDLRSEICRNVSPLQAKMLIYSALYYPFSPRERDWSPMNNYDLDDLLSALYQACETSEDVRSRLYSAAQKSEFVEDSQRTAGVIFQAMRSLFPA